MNHLPRLTSVLATTLLLPLAAQEGGKPITIHPTAGVTARFRNTIKATQNIVAMGQENTTEIASEFEVHVDEVATDGKVKATFTWQRVSGKLASMAGQAEFDTDKEDGDDAGDLAGAVEACHALIGKKVTLTFGPDGKVVDKQPLQQLVDAALEHAEGMSRMAIQHQLSADNLELQASVFGTFASQPVKVGGEWADKRESTRGSGLHILTETSNKLETADADKYVVSTQGKLTMVPAKADKAEKGEDGEDDPQAAMMKSMLSNAKIEGGKLAGSYTVSRKDGLIAEGTSDVELAIHMTNPMGGDEPFVVQVRQTTKQERVTAAAAKATKKPAAKKG